MGGWAGWELTGQFSGLLILLRLKTPASPHARQGEQHHSRRHENGGIDRDDNSRRRLRGAGGGKVPRFGMQCSFGGGW